MSIDAALLKRYQAAGQDHLFTFWPKLSTQERQSLTQQLQALDIERVNRIYQRAVAAEKAANAPDAKQDDIQPLPDSSFESELRCQDKAQQWRAVGLQAIARGELAVSLMAGGQGTRLGSSAPKGCYDIGLPSHKSLFQLQAERISRLQTLAQKLHGKPAVVPWYIMTSGPTRKDTEEFFEKHKFFGLDRKNVVFFQQGK
jgi:UDP-N-acetylglucosamine/UDP-N-acetylgalactosamine diphosphorylase